MALFVAVRTWEELKELAAMEVHSRRVVQWYEEEEENHWAEDQGEIWDWDGNNDD
jgi:hypothetical protein